MSNFLRQATASQSRAIGPFIDDTDFKTAETGLTIANTDIKLVINGAASANKNSGGGTHRVNGVYSITFDATDTATVGEIEVSVVVSGALPVFHKFTVVEEAVYDLLFAASALGYVNNAPVNVAQFGGSNGTFASGRPEVNMSHIAGAAVSASTAQLGVNVVNFGGSAGSFASGIPAVNATQISGDATAADNLENALDDTAGPVPWFGIADQGTAQSATGTTLVLRSAAAFADGTLVGCTLAALGSTQGYWQFREITGYVGSTDTATVDAWSVTPSGTITYKVFGGPPATAAGAGVVADAVWDELLSGHAVSGSAGEALSAAGTAGDPWSTALPGSYGSGTAGKIIGDNINATISSRAAASVLGAAVGASISADIAAVKTQTVAIESDTQDIQSRIPSALVSGRIDASVGAMAANVMTAAAAASDLTTELQSGLATASALSSVAGDVTSVLADTNELQIDWANGGRLDNILDARASQTSVDDLPTNSELATALAAADDAVLAAIAALNNLSAAQVNAEVVDALATDTYAEPGQGAPAATTSLAAKINYLFKAWRNKKDQTATVFSLYDDAGSTVDQKAAISDDGTTTTAGEIVSGP